MPMARGKPSPACSHSNLIICGDDQPKSSSLTAVVEPYNTVLCVRLPLEHIDVTMQLSNEAVYDIGRCNLYIDEESHTLSRHHIPQQLLFACPCLLSAPHSLKPSQNSFRPGCKQFGSTTLSQLYQNFSDEVTFILNPFVYSIDTALKCVDEAAPYPLEQQSMRVVTRNPQSVYVPKCR